MSHKMKGPRRRRKGRLLCWQGRLTAGKSLVLVVKWGLVRSDLLSPSIDLSRPKLKVFE